MARTVDELDKLLRWHKAAIRSFNNERRQAVAERMAAVVVDFDAGMSNVDIAAKHGMTLKAAIALIWRAGRTRTGRRVVRQRIQTAISPGA